MSVSFASDTVLFTFVVMPFVRCCESLFVINTEGECSLLLWHVLRKHSSAFRISASYLQRVSGIFLVLICHLSFVIVLGGHNKYFRFSEIFGMVIGNTRI
jgi:hypothetical protein